MFKNIKPILYGFLFGVILTGIACFFVSRGATAEIRSSYKGIDGDYLRLEQVVSQLRNDADGLTDGINGLNEQSGNIVNRSKSVMDRSGTVMDGVEETKGKLFDISGKLSKVEDWHRQSIVRIRDLADISEEFRRLSEEGEQTE